MALFSVLICIGCNYNNCDCQKYKSSAVIDTLIDNVELVKVSNGWYKSGLNCEAKIIDYTFWIGKYEITNQQFFTFLNRAKALNKISTNHNKITCFFNGNETIKADTFIVKYVDHAIYFDSNNQLALNAKYANHPVIGVSWFGAMAYCNFGGFSLPSANEWEKAARGNNCWRFAWGNYIDETYANYFNNKNSIVIGTTPVGFYNGETNNGFKTNNAVSAYGCYDMCGNAWEWTSDRFDKSASYFYGKGGGFNLHNAAHLQVYYISTFRVNKKNPPLDVTHLSDGFRVVKHTIN